MGKSRTRHTRTDLLARATAGWPEACAGALLRGLARLAGKGPPNGAQRRQAPGGGDGVPPMAEPRDVHLTRLSGVVEAAAGHGERAQRYHEGAGQRIDAALYELDQLRLELQAVVDPALLAGMQRILDASAASAQPLVETPTAAATARDNPYDIPAGTYKAGTFKAGRARSARSAA